MAFFSNVPDLAMNLTKELKKESEGVMKIYEKLNDYLQEIIIDV
jgi:hypothetical protein